MDVKRLFKDDPPKKPITSLKAMVEDWSYRFGKDGAQSHRRDAVVEYCCSAPSFSIAVWRACDSLDREGKMHNHQTRVRATARFKFAEDIISNPGLLRRRSRLKEFDELYDELKSIQPWGIGDVTLYDVAVRIGAFMGLEPRSLYLHAGVREAWDRLNGRKSKEFRIAHSDLPEALRSLPADEVEDCLCTYRELISPSWIGGKK